MSYIALDILLNVDVIVEHTYIIAIKDPYNVVDVHSVSEMRRN